MALIPKKSMSFDTGILRLQIAPTCHCMSSYISRSGISVVNATVFSAADRRGHLHRLYCVSPPHLSFSKEKVKWNSAHCIVQIFTPGCSNISLHVVMVRNFCCQGYSFFCGGQTRTLASTVLCFPSSFICLKWIGEGKFCPFHCVDFIVKTQSYMFMFIVMFTNLCHDIYFLHCLWQHMVQNYFCLINRLVKRPIYYV